MSTLILLALALAHSVSATFLVPHSLHWLHNSQGIYERINVERFDDQPAFSKFASPTTVIMGGETVTALTLANNVAFSYNGDTVTFPVSNSFERVAMYRAYYGNTTDARQTFVGDVLTTISALVSMDDTLGYARHFYNLKHNEASDYATEVTLVAARAIQDNPRTFGKRDYPCVVFDSPHRVETAKRANCDPVPLRVVGLDFGVC